MNQDLQLLTHQQGIKRRTRRLHNRLKKQKSLKKKRRSMIILWKKFFRKLWSARVSDMLS